MICKRMIKKKLNETYGFTLLEALVAILILLMVSSIVAAGIPLARRAYKRVILISNAEVLLSTTISTLRNELGTAQNIDVDPANQEPGSGGTTITYYCASRGASSRIYVQGDNIMFKRYYFDPSVYTMGAGVVPDPEQLISSATATENLSVKYDSVGYSSGIITFKGLAVCYGGSELVKRGDEGKLSIRVISK